MTDRSGEQHERGAEHIELGGLKIHSEAVGGRHVIHLTGELDLATADDVQHELERVEASGARAIEVDLSGLTFMDSTGVRLLVNANTRSRADGGRLVLRRGSPAVQRVMELSGVEPLLSFVD